MPGKYNQIYKEARVKKQGRPYGALEQSRVLKGNQSFRRLQGIYDLAQGSEPLHFITTVLLYEEMFTT